MSTGTNEIKPPDADDRTAAAELAREHLVPLDLVTFYRSVGEVVLADIGNAYFFHSARLVLDHLHTYEPVLLNGADDAQGVLIASDGADCWAGGRPMPPRFGSRSWRRWPKICAST